MTEPPHSAMQQLRDSTRDEHERAEHHEFQQALVKGELARDRYEAWLGQMYLVHHALEKALRDAADKTRPSPRSSTSTSTRSPTCWRISSSSESTRPDRTPTGDPAVPHPRRAGKEDPLLLLGLHYVLEGSNNGGRYIARHVAEAYDLAPGPGLRYLDPYGDQQREYWLAFKTDMGSWRSLRAIPRGWWKRPSRCIRPWRSSQKIWPRT